ncbi:MAG: Ribosomal RNA small subunit methyltransferase I [Smithella sp. PtaU1.Bin162]|nr:MAG: Ribosomal RNA small subunit methyltransferase I [Smithella sp. PtaU1.Bin162]
MTTNDDNSGILYVVATPIGNLEDITLRALRILKEVSLIAAEDTRHTRKLLCAYEITTHLISLHEHNEKEKSSIIIAKIKSGLSAAYVTDAGTPGISDPGYHLVKLAHAENIRVIPVPGASAVITALSVSGFPADNFVFCGFLPAKENKRRKFLEELREEIKTSVFYESPARYLAALRDMYDVLGDREIVVGRELTKIFEEIQSAKISKFLENGIQGKTRGEFTIVVKGKEKETIVVTDEEIENKLLQLWNDKKISLRDAVAEVVQQTGLSRKKVYDLAVKLRS